MSMKIKTITVTYPHIGPSHSEYYQVAQVTDSVEFHPKQFLERTKVDELCASRQWKVIVKPSLIA